jgi:serine/threonine-protein kinase
MKICPTCKTKFSTNVFYCPLEGSRLVEDFESGTSKSMIGTILDERYQVISRLGEGGMGAVYLVEHVTLKKRMAVKVLREEYANKEELVKRFQQEAVAASRIGQENIVDVTDFGRTADGNVYFVMEVLDGPNLADVIKQLNGFPDSRAIPIMKQMCSALSSAHKQGIIHRDLKPENIVLIKRGNNSDFVKILDFGISKMIDTSEGRAEKLTALGMIVGTPEYMSPEQASGSQVDSRTDIYSLGIIMYEMMTGCLPFLADNALQILSKHINEQPVPPSEMRPDLGITPQLEALTLACMAKNRDLRPQSMDEIFTRLEQIAGGREGRSESRHTVAWDSSEVPMPTGMRQAVSLGGPSFTSQQPVSSEVPAPQVQAPRGRTSQLPGVQQARSASEIPVPQPRGSTMAPLPIPSQTPVVAAEAETPAPILEEPSGTVPARPSVIQEIPQASSGPAVGIAVEPSGMSEQVAPTHAHGDEDLIPGRHGKRSPVALIVVAVAVLAAMAAAAFFLSKGKDQASAPPPVVEKKPEPAPQQPAVQPVQPAPVEVKAEEQPKPAEVKPAAQPVQPAQQPSHRTARADSAPAMTRGTGDVTVELNSSPSMAEVYKGGDFIGTTPVRLRGARGGQESYTLKKAGYETLPVGVVYDKTRSMTVELKPSSKGASQPGKKKDELFHKIDDIKNPFK